MKLTTPMQITAADSDARTITGRIVAFNEHANASTGKVVFARGSIQPNDVFLNLEHDNTRRIGRSVAMSVNDKEMTATFRNCQHNSWHRCIDRGHGRLTRWILN
jgi:hypothetical protein